MQSKEGKRICNVSLTPEIADRVREFAKEERRSFSNCVEWILAKHFEERNSKGPEKRLVRH